MAYATITESFKRQLLEDIVADYYDSATSYYIGIGRSEDWNSTDTPTEISLSSGDDISFRKSLQSIKTVESISYVIPRVNWSSNTTYAGVDNNVGGHPSTSFYVITSDNDVFVCVRTGKNTLGANVASVVKPTKPSGSAIAVPFETSDGYMWKYMYTVDTDGIAKFLSTNFVPVKLIDSDYVLASYSDQDSDQWTVQDTAVGGQITSVVVTSGGGGYTSAPTVTIEGDGSGASYTASINNGQVVAVNVNLDSAGADYAPLMGSGFTQATVKFSGGGATTTAAARPNIGSSAGLGANAIVDLRANALMFNSKLQGTESGTFLTGQDFRQIGVIRNPKDSAEGDIFVASSGNALQYISYDSAELNGVFVRDQMIQALDSDEGVAYIDKFDLTNSRIYFHQNSTTGYGQLNAGATIQQVGNPSINTIIGAINNGDIDPLTGEVLYVENRIAVERAADQTEDIKIIIQL